MSWMKNKKVNTRIISILFAVALWLYVASEQNPLEYKPIKDIPVRLINTETVGASGLVIRDPQQHKVDVNIQGKRSVLAEIKTADILAEADLRGYTRRGVNNVPVEIRGLPSNVELVDYSPKALKWKWNRSRASRCRLPWSPKESPWTVIGLYLRQLYREKSWLTVPKALLQVPGC